jgi:hypothetical protein
MWGKVTKIFRMAQEKNIKKSNPKAASLTAKRSALTLHRGNAYLP